MKTGEGWRAVASMTLVASALMLAIAAAGGDWRLGPLAGFVVVPHALLGLLVYALVRQRGDPSFAIALLAGVVVGATPVALLTLATSATSEMVGGIDLVVGGHRTVAGWVQWCETVAICGGCGGGAGIAFWAATRVSRHRSMAWIITLVATVLTGTLVAVPLLTRDRSCHNVFRNGDTSIGSQANIEVAIGEDDWPALMAEFAAFRREWHWSLRTDLSPPSNFYRQLDISVCDDAGTVLRAQAVKSPSNPVIPTTAMLSIMQPQGGLSWRAPAAGLVSRVEHRWPGRVTFKARDGAAAPRPAWLAPTTSEKVGDANGNHR